MRTPLLSAARLVCHSATGSSLRVTFSKTGPADVSRFAPLSQMRSHPGEFMTDRLALSQIVPIMSVGEQERVGRSETTTLGLRSTRERQRARLSPRSSATRCGRRTLATTRSRSSGTVRRVSCGAALSIGNTGLRPLASSSFRQRERLPGIALATVRCHHLRERPSVGLP
jgi:hypothetical protein